MKNSKIFLKTLIKPGNISNFNHFIKLTDERPFKLRNYRSGPKEQEAIENEVSKMLKNNVISASQSPYSSPVLLVTKKDGSIRFCVDYRKLNSLTQKDAYNLPRIDDILDQIGGSSSDQPWI